MNKKPKKIFVGLSGGVDSSVAAALLVQQGYEVTGVFMKNWSRDVAGHQCPWRDDLASARSVAAHLNIPFKVYDFEKQYFESVTKYMLDTYQKGLTPNPDIMCNQEIKFKVFYKKCIAEGADMIATGHYAVIEKGKLKSAVDIKKDQTYFLYRINPAIAEKVLFPVGGYKKSKVRDLAKEFNMPTANRPDSQGLCFVGNVPMKDFLAEFIKPHKGAIVDEYGNIVGEHEGAFSFTIGQRHGLGVGGGKPYFVYKLDVKTNKVFVSTDENILNSNEFIITDCVWWDKTRAEGESFKARAKVRYRSKSIQCMVSRISNHRFQIKLIHDERAITPGQSAVLYSKNTVVGGGIIV